MQQLDKNCGAGAGGGAAAAAATATAGSAAGGSDSSSVVSPANVEAATACSNDTTDSDGGLGGVFTGAVLDFAAKGSNDLIIQEEEAQENGEGGVLESGGEDPSAERPVRNGSAILGLEGGDAAAPAQFF